MVFQKWETRNHINGRSPHIPNNNSSTRDTGRGNTNNHPKQLIIGN